MPQDWSVAFHQMLNLLLVRQDYLDTCHFNLYTKLRWGGHQTRRVPLDGAAQEAEAQWQGLVALWGHPHQQVVCHLRCSLRESGSGQCLYLLISFIISKTNPQVRVGEWNVVDTNSFDRKKCAYYDSKTKTQCEGARFCRRRCSLENAKIDCIPSSRGQEKCSEEVQVDTI